MLNKEELARMLLDIENERVERTVTTNKTDKFAEAICAFANDLGDRRKPGYLLIGANDNGSLAGISVSDELLRNLAALRSDGNILPQPALMTYKVTFDGGDIAVVEVQPSKLPPVRYKGNIWVRVGARKAIANEEEENILIERRRANSMSFDCRPCFEATIEDLDMNAFTAIYLPKAISEDVIQEDKRSAEQQMASLRLWDKHFNCPTNAGILLLARNPKYFIFGAYIQYVKFDGNTKAAEIVKEVEFNGNLIKMLSELDTFVTYSIENKRPVFVSSLREEYKVTYPQKAIRELLMNAVMHRTYEGSNAPIRFYEYADHIEIDNPGNLYGKARQENFPDQNDYRNPILAEAMRTLGYVNKFGRGISMVQNALATNGNGEAVFFLNDLMSFKVVVRNADNQKNVHEDVHEDVRVNVHEGKALNASDRRDKVVSLLTKNPRLSFVEIAATLLVSPKTIYRDFLTLKKRGLITRVGSDKDGYWSVNTSSIAGGR